MPEAILTDRIESLPAGERWSVCARLRELSIDSECPADGSLQITIKNSCEAILVCMILSRCVASRRQQVEWLYRCWDLAPYPGE